MKAEDRCDTKEQKNGRRTLPVLDAGQLRNVDAAATRGLRKTQSMGEPVCAKWRDLLRV